MTEQGVVFPVSDDGRRSTTSVGRAVVAEALRTTDPVGALDAEQETSWRSGYPLHFRRLVEAGLTSREAAVDIATAGLASLQARMTVADAGDERRLDEWSASKPSQRLETVELRGRGRPERELSLPFRGERLHGDALRRRLDTWASAGVLEPSAVEALSSVMANPEWLHLEGRTVAVLGAAAEMGPLQALLRWGARVAAIDLPRPDLWGRVLHTASAGTLLVPTRPDPGGAGLERRAGADLLADVPAVARWLGDLPGPLVLGNYVY